METHQQRKGDADEYSKKREPEVLEADHLVIGREEIASHLVSLSSFPAFIIGDRHYSDCSAHLEMAETA